MRKAAAVARAQRAAVQAASVAAAAKAPIQRKVKPLQVIHHPLYIYSPSSAVLVNQFLLLS